jgi:hypothetical protein
MARQLLASVVAASVLFGAALPLQAQNPPASSQQTPAQQAKTAAHTAAVNSMFAYQLTLSCPGSFPTDLTIQGCAYRPRQRWKDFITNNVTDKAWLSAVWFGAIDQATKVPREWPRTWEFYGHRVGVLYTQTAAKGAAQMLLGFALKDDPRNVSLINDPRTHTSQVQAARKCATTPGCVPNLRNGSWSRIGHAFKDTFTVRRSADDGDGRRIPAISRFGADFASAYGGYPWYPARENKFDRAGIRAADALLTATMYSFYTEFSPEISGILGSVFKRGKAPKPAGGK